MLKIVMIGNDQYQSPDMSPKANDRHPALIVKIF